MRARTRRSRASSAGSSPRSRFPRGGSGKDGRVEPEQRESEPEDVAAERAADATEESRRRRGEDDVLIEDEDPFTDEGEDLEP